MNKFNVVLCNKGKEVSAYAGIITWTSLTSEEDFEAWYDDEMKENYDILAKGVSDGRAIEITEETPLVSRVAVALFEADGNDDMLRMRLATIALTTNMFDAFK